MWCEETSCISPALVFICIHIAAYDSRGEERENVIQVQREVEIGVRKVIGCYNAADKYWGIKIKVTDHFS